MRVKEITIETIRYPRGGGERQNVVVLWTEDGVPHVLPDTDHNVAYATQLFDKEEFEIVNESPLSPTQAEPGDGGEQDHGIPR